MFEVEDEEVRWWMLWMWRNFFGGKWVQVLGDL